MFDIRELLELARSKKASDIHITVGVPPTLRINGELVETDFQRMMPPDTEAFADGLMNEKQKQEVETSGQADFAYSLKEFGRYRVNIFKQRGSYAATMRLVGTRIPTPEELNIPESVVRLTDKRRGMVLVTGPTGSGKSTTLASLIDQINKKYNVHIITLEDPIEYLHRHQKAIVNQREMGLDSVSYAQSLRAALRQDPDVILVGEMRDLETISIAVTAAETGHLVFSTLHTIGAASTIDRIIDVFPPYQQDQIRVQLASVLECVISQQLLPKADGSGRLAAFEVMHANTAIRNLVREGKTHQISSIIQTNRKSGMNTMDDYILDLYNTGKISWENALSFAVDSAMVSRRVGGDIF